MRYRSVGFILLGLCLQVTGCAKSYQKLSDALNAKTDEAVKAVTEKASQRILSQMDNLDKSDFVFKNISGFGEAQTAEVKKIVADLVGHFPLEIPLAIKNETFSPKFAAALHDAVEKIRAMPVEFKRFGAVEVPAGDLKNTKLSEHGLFKTTFYSKDTLLDAVEDFVKSNTGG